MKVPLAKGDYDNLTYNVQKLYISGLGKPPKIKVVFVVARPLKPPPPPPPPEISGHRNFFW